MEPTTTPPEQPVELPVQQASSPVVTVTPNQEAQEFIEETGPGRPSSRSWRFVASIVSALIIASVIWVVANNRREAAVKTQAQSNYVVTTVPLDQLAKSGVITVDDTGEVLINGQLRVNGASVATSGTTVGTIGGLSGNVGVGPGLGTSGSTLVNTGVTTIQGQAGNVTLLGGNGISINGTTVTNAGVTSITTGNGLTASAASGNIVISLPQGVSTSSTPTFSGLQLSNLASNRVLVSGASGDISELGSGNAGQCLVSQGPNAPPTFINCAGGGSGNISSGTSQTAGRIVKFDSTVNSITDSLLSELGTTVTVNGSLTVAAGGVLSGNGQNLTSVNAATLNSQSASFYQNAGNLNAGTLSDTRLSGNVTLQGNTFNGANQLVQLDASLKLPVASGANLTNLNGSAVSSGTVGVSFGGTGASTAANARTNLGAAASGVNNDISSLGVVSSISNSGGNLTVGSTTRVLTLQGSGASVFTVTSGANTTTLSFTAPTAARSITLPDATGTVCLSTNNCGFALGGSGVTSLQGLTGALTINNATGSGSAITINDATTAAKGIASFAAADFSVASGAVSLNVVAVNKGGTGATTAANARTNLGAAASGANADITSLTALTTINPGSALTIGATGQALTLQGNGSSVVTATSGGFTSSLGFAVPTANRTITIPDATGTVCLSTNNCGFALGGSGVTSLQGLSGALTINNATGSGSAITIDDATTAAKGIASFSATDFSVSSGAVSLNTVAVNKGGTGSTTASGARSNLGAAASGANADITSLTALTAITPGAALTVGASGQNLTLQGAATLIKASSGGFTTTVGFQSPTANVTYTFDTTTAGSYDVCTTAGNCVGTGGALAGSGTAGKIAYFTNASTLASSILTESGTNIDVGGTLSVGSANALTLGSSLGNDGAILFKNATNSNVLTLQSGATQSNLTFTLPTADGSSGQCLKTNSLGVLSFGDCLSGSGAGGGVASLNSLTGALSIAGTSNQITVTPGGSTITLSTPQDIATASSPTFSALSLTGASGLTVGTASVLGKTVYRDGSTAFKMNLQPATLTADRTITLPNAGGTVAVSASGNIALDSAGNITFTGILPVANGGTGSATAAGARSNLGAAASGANSDITSLSAANTITPTAALTVGSTSQNITLQGAVTTLSSTSGSFTSSLVFATPAANATITIPNATGTVCLSTNNCGYATAGSGVTSLNGLSGALTINNSSGSGSAVTIDDASTAAKGIAKFNSTNFSVATGTVNTIQDISTSATPTFATLTTTGAINGQTVSSAASFTGTLAFATLGSAGSTALCQNGSNQISTCSGNANNVTLQQAYNASTSPEIVVNATNGALTVRDNATPIGARLLEVQNNAGTVTYLGVDANGATVTGTLTASGDINSSGGALKTNGTTRIANNGDATLGAVTSGLINGQTISSTANLTGTLALATLDSTQGNTPVCRNASNLLSVCGSNAAVVTLQQAYNASANPELVLDATRGALTVRDNATPIGANLLEVQNNAGTTTYFGVTSSGVSVTGTTTSSGNFNTTGGVYQVNGTSGITNASNCSAGNFVSGTQTVGGIVTSVTCGSSTSTLQQAYNASSNPELVVDATRGALTVRDNATPIGANLLEVQNNAGTTTYFNVDATGATATNFNTTGVYKVNGTSGITNASNCSAGQVVTGTQTTGGIVTSVTCGTNSNTLQQAYNASTSPELVLDATRGALTVRDASSPLGANLLEVQDNGGTNTYFAVTSGGATVNGALAVNSGTATNTITSSATSGNGTTETANSLTTGNALQVASSSTALTSGNLLSLNHTSTYSSGPTVSGNLVSATRSLTSNAPVQLDTSFKFSTTSSNTLNTVFTVANNANRMLVVTLMTSFTNYSSVTYNGVAMTQSAQTIAGGGCNNVTIFTLANPATGTNTLSITMSGSLNTYIVGTASSWYNVSSVGTAATEWNTGTSTTLNLTTQPGGVVTGGLDLPSGISSLSSGSGQNLLGGSTFTQCGTDTLAWDYKSASSSSTSTSWSWTGSVGHGYAAIPLNPSNALNVTGAVGSLSSNCTATSGVCSDSSSILSLNQQYASATGSVLNIQNSGSGADIQLASGLVQTAAGTSSNGVSIKTGNASAGNSGSITIDSGTASGTAGNINIGTGAYAHNITIGNATGTSAVSIVCGTGTCGIGNNSTDHSTTVGSTTGSSVLTLQSGTGGAAVTSTASSNNALSVTGGGITTGNGLALTTNALTTGNGLQVTSTSSLLTTGNLVKLSDAATYTTPGNTVSGNIINSSRSLTSQIGVQFDSSIGYGPFSVCTGASCTPFAVTVANNSNRALVVILKTDSASTVSSVTFNGTGMTAAGSIASPGSSKLWAYTLLNPTATTANLVVNFSTTGTLYAAGATSWYNAASFGSSVTNSNTSNTISTNVTTQAGGEVADAWVSAGGTPYTLGSGQTGFDAPNLYVAASNGQMFSYKAAVGTTTTMTWTANASGANAAIAVPINPAASVLTVTGAVASFTSTCAVTAGGCTDSSNILNLNQQYASATGAVLNIQNAGTGVDILMSTGKQLSGVANSGTAIGYTLNTASFSTVGAKLLSVQNNGAEKFAIDKDGNAISTGGIFQTPDTSTAFNNSNGLTLRSGNATGGSSNSGSVTIDSGTATGTAGGISIGTGAYAHNTTVGNATGTSAISLQSGTGGVSVTSTTQTGNASSVTDNSLTSGNALLVQTTSANLTSGNLVGVSQASTYTSALALSNNLLNISRAATANVSSTAVTLDTSAILTGNSAASSFSWSHTVGSFSNRVLFVSFEVNNNTVSPSSVTYSGQAMTLLTSKQDGGAVQEWNYVYYLLNPPAGTANVVINLSGSSSVAAISQSWYNVLQSVPTSASASGGSSAPSVGIATVAGDTVIDFSGAESAPSSPSAGQTLVNTVSLSGPATGVSSSYKTGITGTTTMSYTSANSSWASIAADVKQAAAPGLVVTGSVASISDNCTVTAGACANSANVLNLNQQYASASGAVLAIQNSGTGADILLGTGKLSSSITNSSTAIGFVLNTGSFTTSGAKLLSVQNNSTEKFSVDKDGSVSSVGGIYQTPDVAVGVTFSSSNDLTLRSGNALTTGSNSGQVTVDSGNASGTPGNVSIGTGSFSHNTTVGNTTGTSSLALKSGTGGVAVTSTTQTGNASSITDNSLTSGNALLVQSTSANLTSGNLVGASHTATYTTGQTTTNNIANISRTITANTGAVQSGGNQGSVSNSTGASLSIAATVTAQSNRILIVQATSSAGCGNSSSSTSSVTYGGVAMTLLAQRGNVGSCQNASTSYWYMINPAASGTITANFSNANNANMSYADFYNINATTPFGTPISNAVNAGSVSVSLTANAGDLIVEEGGSDSNSGPGITNTTETWRTSVNPVGAGFSGGGIATKTAAAGSNTLSISTSSGLNTAMIAVVLKPTPITLTGNLAQLSSQCSVTSGDCADSSNILSLNQQYASASGAVLAITNSGTGSDVLLGTGKITSSAVNSASAVGFLLNTGSLTTAGAKLLSVRNNGTEQFSIDKDGNVNIASGAAYSINGANINTGGTLSNVAYLNQNNAFSYSGTNSFTSTSTLTNAFSITGNSLTTGAGLAVAASTTTGNAVSINASGLTTGNGIQVTSSSSGLTSGNLLNLSLSPSLAGTVTQSGNVANISRSITAGAQLSLDGSVVSSGSTASITVSDHGDNKRLLVVATQCGQSLSFNGSSMTQLAGTGGTICFYYLKQPSVGTFSITNASGTIYSVFASSWFNVDQTNPMDTGNSNAALSLTMSPTTTTDMVVDYLWSAASASGGQTGFIQQNGLASATFGFSYKAGLASSTTMTWTGTANTHIGAVIHSASAAVTVSGSAANIVSNCTVAIGTCSDTANILNLNQQYASASGSVLNIQNAGSGAAIALTQTGSSTVDIQLAKGTLQTAAGTTSTAVNLQSGNASAGVSGAVTLQSGTGTTGSGALTITSGNASAGASGNVTIDTGTFTSGTPTISIGTANASAVSIGRSGQATTINGTLTVTQAVTLSSTLSVKDTTINGHLKTGNSSGSTTAAVNANAGTSGACTISGNDTGGQVTLTTGSGAWAAGVQCTITFANTYSTTAPHPVITSANSTDTSVVKPYVDVPGTSPFTTWTLNFINADTGANTYKFNYFNAQ